MKSKSIICSLLIMVAPLIILAQIAPKKYYISFTDKNNSPYSLSAPAAFLSPKALSRRTRQNITLQYNDLPVTPAYIDSVAAKGVAIGNLSKWLNAVIIETNDTTILPSIQALPFVSGVKQVKKRSEMLAPVKEFFRAETVEPLKEPGISFKTQTYNYGSSYNQINMIGGDILHNNGFRGEGITIAILDAGFWNVNTLAAFDSLRVDNRILGTWDLVQGDTSVFEDDAHGMMVLSTIAGYLPGQLVGTAPKASFWLLRSEDTGSEYLIEEYNWVSAAEFADSVGADIINSSLGYRDFNDPSQNHSYADLDGNTTPVTIGADIAASKGILVVNSAGNEGSNSWKYIIAPADGDSVLAVGAVDASKNYASFSSKGYSFDGRIKPDIACQGQNVIVATTSGSVGGGSGTSFASPIIAGMAACLWQANPSFTNIQIIKAIEESATQYNNPDSILGYGIPNFVTANLILSGKDLTPLHQNKLISVYPNPFSESIFFTFYSDTSQKANLELVNILGQVIHTEILTLPAKSYVTKNISAFRNMNAGIYFLKISCEREAFTQKIIKQ